MRTRHLGQSYILMVSLYQLAILCQFNAADAFSYKELQTATSLNDQTLKGSLVPLVKSKLLLVVKEDGEESYELNYSASAPACPLSPARALADRALCSTDRPADFKSKKVRIPLNMPIKAEARVENAQLLKDVDEDRKFLIQATIVRVMKSRKTMKHNVRRPPPFLLSLARVDAFRVLTTHRCSPSSRPPGPAERGNADRLGPVPAQRDAHQEADRGARREGVPRAPGGRARHVQLPRLTPPSLPLLVRLSSSPLAFLRTPTPFSFPQQRRPPPLSSPLVSLRNAPPPPPTTCQNTISSAPNVRPPSSSVPPPQRPPLPWLTRCRPSNPPTTRSPTHTPARA